jgi:copper chaperone CopZ
MNESCYVDPVQKVVSPAERSNTSFAVLAVWGMGCPNCANRVHNSLLALRGVVDVNVDHVTGIAVVNFNSDLTTPQFLIGAVARAGGDGKHEYGAPLIKEVTT